MSPEIQIILDLATCYNNYFIVDCDSIEFPGQDGYYQAGCLLDIRFVDNGDGTVTDNCTGLMWEQKTSDIDGDGQVSRFDLNFPGGDQAKWQDSLQYCDNLNFAGYDDWRLPNIKELFSLTDFGRNNPTIDPIFEAGASALYWSSTSLYGYGERAHSIHFGGAGVSYSYKNSLYFSRAVRTIQPGE